VSARQRDGEMQQLTVELMGIVRTRCKTFNEAVGVVVSMALSCCTPDACVLDPGRAASMTANMARGFQLAASGEVPVGTAEEMLAIAKRWQSGEPPS
jgi:hypothetical protein